MQRALILLLVTAFLAGCADETEPTGDLPPEGALPPDSGGTSTSRDGFAPQTGYDEDVQGDLGLAGNLRVSDCEEPFCIHAVATNEGTTSYHVSDICVSPWSESMQQRQSAVQKSEPYAVCMAWGLREFAPGEQIEANFTWDGKLWDDDAGQYYDAPEDSYTWTIHFEAFGDADGGDPVSLRLDFPVIVGET